MPADAYSLSLEIKLIDATSKAMTDISSGVDKLIEKFKDLQKVVSGAGNQIQKNLADVAKQSEEMVKITSKQETASVDAGNAAKAVAVAHGDAISDNTAKLAEQARTIEKVTASGEKALTATEIQQRAAQKAGKETEKVISGGIRKISKATGVDLMGSLRKAIGFLGPIGVAYAGFLTLVEEELDALAQRADKFATALYHGAGNMMNLALTSISASAGLRVMGSAMDETLMALREVGVGRDQLEGLFAGLNETSASLVKTSGIASNQLEALAETTAIFVKATGASVQTSAQFVKVMTTVSGSTRTAEASMMMLYKASAHFGLSGRDVNAVMSEVIESAITLRSLGPKSVEKYTESLVMAAAAAKMLGVNVEKAMELVARTKDPLDSMSLKILRASALMMDPAERMEAILKQIPQIASEYERNVRAMGAGRAMIVLKARYELTPEQLKIFEKMTETREIMIKASISTAAAEKSLEDLKSAANEAATSLWQEFNVLAESFKSVVAVLASFIVPILKPIAQFVNGVLSVVIALIAPVAKFVMELFSALDISKEMGGAFALLRNLASAIGKVLSVAIFVLEPGLFLIFGLIAALKVVLKLVTTILGPFIDIINWMGEGMWDAIMMVVSGIKEILSFVTEIVTLGGILTEGWRSLEWILKPIAKIMGVIVGLAMLYYIWTQKTLYLKAYESITNFCRTIAELYRTIISSKIISVTLTKAEAFWAATKAAWEAASARAAAGGAIAGAGKTAVTKTVATAGSKVAGEAASIGIGAVIWGTLKRFGAWIMAAAIPAIWAGIKWVIGAIASVITVKILLIVAAILAVSYLVYKIWQKMTQKEAKPEKPFEPGGARVLIESGEAANLQLTDNEKETLREAREHIEKTTGVIDNLQEILNDVVAGKKLAGLTKESSIDNLTKQIKFGQDEIKKAQKIINDLTTPLEDFKTEEQKMLEREEMARPGLSMLPMERTPIEPIPANVSISIPDRGLGRLADLTDLMKRGNADTRELVDATKKDPMGREIAKILQANLPALVDETSSNFGGLAIPANQWA